jgi:hypothetical protein
MIINVTFHPSFCHLSFHQRPQHPQELKLITYKEKNPTCIISLSIGGILDERKSDVSHEFLSLFSVVSVYLELPALYISFSR